MRRNEDPCRDPASEARDDWADTPYESYCFKIDPATGELISKIAKSEEEEREFFDPNNLEGPGPTDEERRANARAISAVPVHERFALMFRGTNPES